MSSLTTRTASALAIAVLLASSLSARPTYAVEVNETANSLSVTISEAVEIAAPEISNVVRPVVDQDDGYTAEVRGPSVSGRVEIQPTLEGVVLTLDGGVAESKMGLELPELGLVTSPEIADDGTAVFEAGDANVDVGIQALSDGAVRAVTVINGIDSPTEYEYDFDLPEGVVMKPTQDGGVRLYNDGGEMMGAILPAWAVDGAGTSVPTRYEVQGSKLTQIVAHDSQAVEYPVVADPKIYYAWWQIFSWTEFHTPRAYPTGQLSIALSGWGRWDVIMNAGQFLTSGWNLLKSKYPSRILKTSMRQQWDCHVLGGIAEWGTFDLEMKRPPNANWRSRVGMLPPSATCNW